MDWSNVPEGKKRQLCNRVSGSPAVYGNSITSSQLGRSTTTRGSQSSKDMRAIGQHWKRQKGLLPDGGRMHMPTAKRLPLRSTRTTPPTPRRETRQHRVVDGILCRSLCSAKVRARRLNTPRGRRKTLGPLHRSLQIRTATTRRAPTPRTLIPPLTPLPVHPNYRMLAQVRSAHANVCAGRRRSRDTRMVRLVCETLLLTHTADVSFSTIASAALTPSINDELSPAYHSFQLSPPTPNNNAIANYTV